MNFKNNARDAILIRMYLFLRNGEYVVGIDDLVSFTMTKDIPNSYVIGFSALAGLLSEGSLFPGNTIHPTLCLTEKGKEQAQRAWDRQPPG